MHLGNTINNFFKRVQELGPLSSIKKTFNGLIDKITFGRGLKIWSKPKISFVKQALSKFNGNFYEFKLNNGLKVLLRQAPGTQVVSNLVFDSGAACDPKDKKGLAHFLEHMVFSNSKDYKDHLFGIADVHGGSFNAGTSLLNTCYTTGLPKDKLELGLKILRSLMTNLELKPEKVKKEAGIINAEINMTESNIRYKLDETINGVLYGQKHLRTHNIIGDKDSVNSITVEDLQKFYDQEYNPANASLVISGDFDLTEAKNLITKYFADIENKQKHTEIDLNQEVNPSKEQVHKIKDDSLTNAIKICFPTDKFKHRDLLIGLIIAHALAAGHNSRLKKKLIDEPQDKKPKAVSLGASCFMDQFSGVFSIAVSPLDKNLENNLKEAKEQIWQEIEDIKQNGVDAIELKRTIQAIETEEIFAKDSQHAGIQEVSGYKQNGEDWGKALTKLEDLKTITNEEIKKFASKYLNKENHYEFDIRGSGQDFGKDFAKVHEQNQDPLSPAQHNLGADKKALQEIIKLAEGYSKLQAHLNNLGKHKLKDGTKIYHKEDNSLPIIFSNVFYPGGMLSISNKEQDKAAILLKLLAETGTYNPKTKIRLDKKALEDIGRKLGTRIDFGIGLDRITYSMSCLSKNYDKATAVLNEMVNYSAILEDQDPTITKMLEDELDKIKKASLDALQSTDKSPLYTTKKTFANTIYPKEHQLHIKELGDQIKEIQGIKLDDLRKLYQKMFKANNLELTAVGDVSLDQLQNQLLPIYRQKTSEQESKPDYNRITAVEAPKANIKIVEAKTKLPQSLVMIGNPTNVEVDSKHHLAAEIASDILGHSSKGRLFNNVREKFGLVYHIGSNLTSFIKGCGPFSIVLGCEPAKAKAAIAAVLATVKEFLSKGITDEELELSKTSFKVSRAVNQLRTRETTAGTLIDLIHREKDESDINNFNEKIDKITKEDVMTAAREIIKPENFTIVVSKPKGLKVDINKQQTLTAAA